MKRFKRWLFETFLPAYCKEKLLEENQRLREQNLELKKKVENQQFYIDGLETGIKSARRITINNNGG